MSNIDSLQTTAHAANRTMDIVSQFMNVSMGRINRRKEKETFTLRAFRPNPAS